MAIEPSETILEFCAAERISRSHFYGLKKRNLGPDLTYSGKRVTITPEAHRRWRKRRTGPAGKPTSSAAPVTSDCEHGESQPAP
jgi:hypothetical protein